MSVCPTSVNSILVSGLGCVACETDTSCKILFQLLNISTIVSLSSLLQSASRFKSTVDCYSIYVCRLIPRRLGVGAKGKNACACV